MLFIVNAIILFAYFLFSKFTKISEKSKRKIILFLIGTQLTLIAGTRTLETGTDTGGYFLIFNKISGYTRISNYDIGYEPLFTLLCFVLGKHGIPFIYLNLLIAGMTMLFLCMAIYKISDHIFCSIFLYLSFCLFDQMMNQMRQILAMAIILYAVSFFKDNNPKKFVIWILIATLFHYSSIIAIVLLFLYKVEINKKIIFGYLIVSILGFSLIDFVFYILSFTVYGSYIGGFYDVEFRVASIMNLIVRLLMLFICLWFYPRIKKKRNDIDIYYHMALICTALQLITVKSALFGRVTTIFFYSYFVLLPDILLYGYRKKSNKKIVSVAFIVVVLLYHYVYIRYSPSQKVQYSSYLFG